MSGELRLDDRTTLLFERALKTGNKEDVIQSKDPVLVAFAFEIARHVILIEERIGTLAPPPAADE